MLVEVTEGKLKGEKLRNALTSDEYYSFKGIPFAKPPVGPLRFKIPEPPEQYSGVWDATEERSPCIQKGFAHSGLGGEEDCLYLNVYSPKLPEKGETLKPVMFYLFGGGFTEGQKDAFLYGPDFLVAKDVVLVVPNYRLHILGFLNLGIPDCSGNIGLHDQLAALKWTKANISKFGGDPNNVTIFGESAGAVSVQFLLYSPLSRGKGLFHKAIVQSGNFMHDRSFGNVAVSTERAARLAKKLGFESADPQELHKFLMGVSAHDLTLNALGILTQKERESGELFPFTPTIETAGEPNDRLITARGSQMAQQDPGVPILSGLCDQEAMLSLKQLITEKAPAEQFISRAESVIIPILFKRNLTKDEEKEKEIVKKFNQFYFQGKSTYEEIIKASIDLYGDIMYNKGFYDYTLANLKHSSLPMYSYLFTYHGTVGFLEHMFNYKRPSFLKGAGHTDELGYLFHQVLKEGRSALESEADRKIISHMTTIWSNFAKFSDPGKDFPVDFKPVTLASKGYLNINEELTIISGIIFEERMKFIDSICASVIPEAAYCIQKH